MKSLARAGRTLRASKESSDFKRAAGAYLKKATSSKKAANSTLVAIGTHTIKGRLTKNYK